MSIEEVRALVAERQRYDDWLAALEAKRTETPPRVFERVHGDYLGRRTEVIARLQEHVGTLSTLGDDLEARLSDLEARLATLEDERDEAMLRNLVGEYDSQRWDHVRQDVEAKIVALGDERGNLLIEFDEVRTLLASARTEPEPAPEPVAEPEPAPASDVLAVESPETPDAPHDDAPTVLTEPVLAAVADAESLIAPDNDGADNEDSLLDIDVSGMVNTPPPSPGNHEDVLADVAAMFDTSSIAAVPAPTGNQAGEFLPSNPAEFDDALAMFGESTTAPDPQFVQSLDGITANHEPPAAAPRPDVHTATATPPHQPAAAEADPFDDLAFLRSVIDPSSAATSSDMHTAPAVPAAAEPQKTLRCTECSTMNLPTEWYCERCGGELAAF